MQQLSFRPRNRHGSRGSDDLLGDDGRGEPTHWRLPAARPQGHARDAVHDRQGGRALPGSHHGQGAEAAQAHPDEDLGLYVDQILEPIEVSYIQSLFDAVSFGQPKKKAATEARQEELRIQAEDPKRIQAEEILKNAGKPVTDANIEFVKGKL